MKFNFFWLKRGKNGRKTRCAARVLAFFSPRGRQEPAESPAGQAWRDGGQGGPNTLLFIYCPTFLFFLLTMEFW